jgi:hypothetical protein
MVINNNNMDNIHTRYSGELSTKVSDIFFIDNNGMYLVFFPVFLLFNLYLLFKYKSLEIVSNNIFNLVII